MHLPKLAGLLSALALSSACFAQTTDVPPPPAKKADPGTHVQVTSDTSGKRHCRDTDSKSADGTTPAQTSMNDRLAKAQADCKKDPPKVKGPDSKDALKEHAADRSSVPPG